MSRTHIVLHHSLTKDSGTVSWDAIRRYHTTPVAEGGRGWSDIGYHFGVEEVGGRYEIFLGRPLRKVGAHCKEGNMNTLAFGICMVGNFDLLPPPALMLVAVRSLCIDLMWSNGIPAQNVIGHREAGMAAGFDYRVPGQYKSCPGLAFDLEGFRSTL